MIQPQTIAGEPHEILLCCKYGSLYCLAFIINSRHKCYARVSGATACTSNAADLCSSRRNLRGGRGGRGEGLSIDYHSAHALQLVAYNPVVAPHVAYCFIYACGKFELNYAWSRVARKCHILPERGGRRLRTLPYHYWPLSEEVKLQRGQEKQHTSTRGQARCARRARDLVWLRGPMGPFASCGLY